jgi:hypothetical protein
MSDGQMVHIQLNAAFPHPRARSDATEALMKTMTAHLRRSGFIDVARSVARLRDDRQAQDPGALIGIVLAAPAMVQVAKGIADYLRGLAPKDRRFEMKLPDGSSIAFDNPTMAELETAMTAFTRK